MSTKTPNPLNSSLRASIKSINLNEQAALDNNSSGVKCFIGKYELLIKPAKEAHKTSFYDLDVKTPHPALASPSSIRSSAALSTSKAFSTSNALSASSALSNSSASNSSASNSSASNSSASNSNGLNAKTTLTACDGTTQQQALISQSKASHYLDALTEQFCKDSKSLAHRAIDDLIEQVNLKSTDLNVEQDNPKRLQLIQDAHEKIDAALHKPNIKKTIVKILENFQIKLTGSKNSQWSIKDHFKALFSTQLNQQDWSVPVESYEYKGQHFNLLRTPGSKVTSLIKKYQDKGFTGICSGSIDSLKKCFTPNLWITKLTNNQGDAIFKGIRHGVIRSEAASEDVLKAAFEVSKSDTGFDRHYQDHLTPNNPYPLKMASIALLTPSKLFGRATLERELIDKQWQALKALNNSKQPFPISHTLANGEEVTIYVKPEILMFNLGTNAVASNTFFNRLSQWIEKLDFLNRFDISGWKKSHQANTDNLQKLLNWALDLSATHTDSQKKLRIENLISSVLELQSNKPQNRPHAYALQKTIALLAYEIGVVPAFNCKSGKDRTAVLETEILAEAMDTHKEARGVFSKASDTIPPTHQSDQVSNLSNNLYFDSNNNRLYDLGNNHIFDLNKNQAYDLNNNQFFDFNENSITDLTTHQTFDLNTYQTSRINSNEIISDLKFNLLIQGNARIQTLNTGLPGNVVFRNTSHFTKVSSVLANFESHQQQQIRGASDWVRS